MFELRIFVDGVDLIELARQAEVAFGEKIAGKYAGMLWWERDLDELPSHFLGHPDPSHQYHHRVQLLECECFEPGCWPLVCRIDVTDDEVRWSDFHQPHRSGRTVSYGENKQFTPDVWDYGDFGFTFEREQYEQALRDVIASCS